MKNRKKILIIPTIALTLLGIIGIANINGRTLQTSKVATAVKAYNSNALNALDNVFEQDGQTVLPFIVSDADKIITKEYLISEFNKKGLTVTNQNNLPDRISTGTIVKTSSKDYNVLIYGDVDGNGKITVYDAQTVFDHWANDEEFSSIVFELAANVYNDNGKITVYDAQTIFDFWMNNIQKLVLNPPISLVEMDTEKPSITLKGDNPQYLELNAQYVELGAIVTDNMDKDVSLVIDSSNVNTSEAGVYYVSYNATDKAGNKANEVKRKVIVKPSLYATGIEIKVRPNNLDYKYDDSIDISGIKVNLVWSDGEREDITNKITLETTKATADGDVIVSYRTNKTIDGEEKTFTDSYKINVGNYITGIRVVQNEVKTYLVGSTITLDGIEVYAIRAFGDSIPVTANTNIKNGEEIATVGTTEINIEYTTSDTRDGQSYTWAGTFTINVEDPTEVNNAVIGDIDDIIEKTPSKHNIPITFKHGNNVIKDVFGKDVTLEVYKGTQKDNTIEAKLQYNLSNGVIENFESQTVEAIALILDENATVGERTIVVKVKGKKVAEKTFKVVKREITIDFAADSVTLYNRIPDGATNVEVEDDFVYSLVKINDIKENGKSLLSTTADNVLTNTLSTNNEDIKVKVMTKNNEKYLLISVSPEEDGIQKDTLDALNGAKLTFTYDGVSVTNNNEIVKFTIRTSFVEDFTEVNNAVIGDIEDIIEKTPSKHNIPITFKHKNIQEEGSSDIKKVFGKDVTLEVYKGTQKDNTIEAKLQYNLSNGVIENFESQTVEAIALILDENATVGERTIVVKVKGKKVAEKTFKVVKREITIDFAADSVTLYNKIPDGATNIEVEGDFVYSLVKINDIKENGKSLLSKTADNVLTNTLSTNNEDIAMKVITKNNEKYLLISVSPEEDGIQKYTLDALNGAKLTFTYDGVSVTNNNETVELNLITSYIP